MARDVVACHSGLFPHTQRSMHMQFPTFKLVFIKEELKECLFFSFDPLSYISKLNH